MRFMMSLIGFGLASLFIAADAQSPDCNGRECPADAFYEQGLPEDGGGFFTWQDYGKWRGLSASLYMPSGTTVAQCNQLCNEHAHLAEKTCKGADGESYECGGAFQETLNHCALQCIKRPH